MTRIGELLEVVEPVAVVLRPNGSVDVYGDVAIIDQRPAPGLTVEHVTGWDCPEWPGADMYGWQVTCSGHGKIGDPPGFPYSTEPIAMMVATRHRNRFHPGFPINTD